MCTENQDAIALGACVGTGVAASGACFGVVVVYGVGVVAGVAAMVPGAGVSAVSGVGDGPEQAAMAARITRMGVRRSFCTKGLLRWVRGISDYIRDLP